ncbi:MULTISPECIES: adenosine deaminase [unclassified Clostridium]|uniref:adenosine deaminase n=1 Tax=unclassified Clostridium TaxID=2614128 RepID=UPI001F280582|nr:MULTISPECIES: adenosine deaminase [unclassified Clostridium]MCF6460424.1 adenosine deaminase [Clostridium sp. Cult3]WMJ79385.1 adenosine deaminase [Clostridium sp. MB40-C1]
MNFFNLPKIELHCHLDGSVRPNTVIDIAKKEGINIPSSDVDTIKHLMIAPAECTSLNEYLERFVLPLKVMQSKESLRRIAYELLEDAAKENVKYIEVRFAPLLHTEKGLTVKEIIQNVLKGMKEAEKNFDIKGNLILSFLKHMSPNSIFDVIEQGKNFLGNGVVGVDLCGSENEGFSKEFIHPIALAREYGYRVTIHAGETGVGENVLEAVELLGAERIGHGVAIRDCTKAYNIVREKGIILEMCPTSNVQTKAVNVFKEHPIYDFYRDGIKVTVNTDNRTVSNTVLTNECDILFNEFHITYDDYKKIYNDSVDACFIDDELKANLYI